MSLDRQSAVVGRAPALVVDDAASVREVVSRMLLQGGLAADEAGTGAEAMTRVRRRYYDVVLLEFEIPRPNGLEVLRWLRPPERARAVVMITGGAFPVDGEATRLGSAACLRKPLRLRELLRTVRAAMARAVDGESRDPVVRALQRAFFRVGGGDDIAREMGCSVDCVTQRVRQETGLTVPQLLRRLRVASARRALETTDLTVSEIAADVGYVGVAAFARDFRDEAGTTPSAYREERGGSPRAGRPDQIR